MRLKKRKILLGVAVALLGLAVVLSSLTLFHSNRTSMRALDYARRNAGAPARAAQLAARLGAALPPPAFTPAAASVPAPTTASLRHEIEAIQKDAMKLEQDANKVYKTSFLLHARRGGIGGMVLFLPAAQFPDEGSSGPPCGGPALLERVRLELQADRKFKAQLAAGEVKNSAASSTLTACASALLDRTRDVLRADWPDAELAQTLPSSWAFDLAPLAVLREARQGRPAVAAALLERLMRAKLLQRVQIFPSRMPWWDVQRLALRLAEDGLIDDAALARLDHLLVQFRLSEAQLKDLRCAAAVKTIQDFERELDRMGPAQAGAWPGLVRGASRAGARVVLTPLYDALIAWAASDADGYDRALRGPLAITFLLPKIQDGAFSPPDQAAWGGEAAANDGLDLTRLVLAAARFRLARGCYPTRFEALVPQYLESGFQRGALSLRTVDALTVPAQSGRPVSEWPLFIQVRRIPLSAVRLVGMWGYGDRFGWTDRTGLLQPSEAGNLLNKVDTVTGRMLQLMSSRTEDVFVIQVVWPSPEDAAALQALGIPESSTHQ